MVDRMISREPSFFHTKEDMTQVHTPSSMNIEVANDDRNMKGD